MHKPIVHTYNIIWPQTANKLPAWQHWHSSGVVLLSVLDLHQHLAEISASLAAEDSLTSLVSHSLSPNSPNSPNAKLNCQLRKPDQMVVLGSTNSIKWKWFHLFAYIKKQNKWMQIANKCIHPKCWTILEANLVTTVCDCFHSIKHKSLWLSMCCMSESSNLGISISLFHVPSSQSHWT